MLKLQFRDRRQEAVWLVDNNFTIGKNKTNSLVVNDNSVEDQHVEIIQTGQRIRIKDLGSSSGVYLNGVRVIGEQIVSPGNIIKIGDVELEVVDPQQTQATAAPESEEEWSIKATASWMNGQVFEIKGSMTLGRDSNCDIAIPVEHLSRRHAELSIKNGKLFVKDLDSANGTFVNGKEIKDTALKPGDKLKFDVITFTIQGPEQVEEADHDPNKTIIRSAKDFQKEIQEEIKKKASQQAAKPKPAKPAPAQPKPVAAKPEPVEKDKDSWITEAEPEKKSSAALWITASLVLVVAVGAGIYFSL